MRYKRMPVWNGYDPIVLLSLPLLGGFGCEFHCQLMGRGCRATLKGETDLHRAYTPYCLTKKSYFR